MNDRIHQEHSETRSNNQNEDDESYAKSHTTIESNEESKDTTVKVLGMTCHEQRNRLIDDVFCYSDASFYLLYNPQPGVPFGYS